MENELADVSGGVRYAELGLPTTRGAILLPQTVTQFRRQFPMWRSRCSLPTREAWRPCCSAERSTSFLAWTLRSTLCSDVSRCAASRCIFVLSRHAMASRFGERYAAVRFSPPRRTWRSWGRPLCRGTTAARRPRLGAASAAARPRRISHRVSSFDLHIDLCRTGGYARSARATPAPRDGVPTPVWRRDPRTQRTLEVELVSPATQPLASTAFARLLRSTRWPRTPPSARGCGKTASAIRKRSRKRQRLFEPAVSLKISVC